MPPLVSAWRLISRSDCQTFPGVDGVLEADPMNILGMDLSDFSGQYLRAALMVSLLSVWMLVGLFYYLNRYTKRDYFTVWTAAWLFYALWLTLGLKFEDIVAGRHRFQTQAMLCGHFRGVSFVGQPAIFENPRPADVVRPVHAVFAGLDFCQPAYDFRCAGAQRKKLGNATAGVHPAGLEQRVCRRLFFPAAEKNAVRRRGHVGAGFFALGTLSGQLSVFPARMSIFPAPAFLSRPCCNSSSRSA